MIRIAVHGISFPCRRVLTGRAAGARVPGHERRILTREYPPEVYGGAGVHVEFLVRELRKLIDVDVHAFGAPRPEPGVHAYSTPAALAGANAALQTIGTDVEIVAGLGPVDVLHSHTWYANLAGVMGSLLHGVPHVLSAHSLEPSRPWKAEQLGGGYRLSSWAEQEAYRTADAIVAVSRGMGEEILGAYPFVDPARLHVIYNGIDTDLYAPRPDPEVLARYGVDPDRPSVLFVGRITRQKGVDAPARRRAPLRPRDPAGLLRRLARHPRDRCRDRGAHRAAADHAHRGGVGPGDAPPRGRGELLSSATVFACPSVYEPLGIVNLEAMACSTAVVASAIGGIPEVVVDGETGTLVTYTPDDAEGFERTFAEAVNALCADPAAAAALGAAGRRRAVTEFGWDAIARQTAELYRSLL